VLSNGTAVPDKPWFAGCGTTNANGVFHDAPYGGCNAGGAYTLTGTQQMKFTVNGTDYIVRNLNFSFSGTGVGTGTMTNGTEVTKSH
jgi:hypothetical protein